jgi:hypothetical protein
VLILFQKLFFILLIILSFKCFSEDFPLDTTRYNYKQSQVGEQDWQVVWFANPFDTLTIQYEGEYTGLQTIKCMAVFANIKTKQLKIVSPWLTTTIENNNLLSISRVK